MQNVLSPFLPAGVFPTLVGEKLEIHEATISEPLKTNNTGNVRPQTLIIKLLRFTDHDTILKAARVSPMVIASKDAFLLCGLRHLTLQPTIGLSRTHELENMPTFHANLN